MRIFNEAELPWSSSFESEILDQWMSLPHLKHYGRESVIVDFQCAKLKNALKTRQQILAVMIKPGTLVNQHIQPYICSKFGDFSLDNWG